VIVERILVESDSGIHPFYTVRWANKEGTVSLDLTKHSEVELVEAPLFFEEGRGVDKPEPTY